MSDITLDKAIRILQDSMVSNPGINLEAGEVCYFTDEATAAIAKNMNIGSVSNGGSIGVYFRAKGSRVGIGSRVFSSQRQNVRGTVIDQYEGHIYLTSRRMLMVAYKGGFDIKLNKITALEFYNDGFMLVAGGKSYLVYIQRVDKLKRVIQANNVYVASNQGTTSPQDIPIPAQQNSANPPMGVGSAATDTDFSGIPVNSESTGGIKSHGGIGLWIGFVVFSFFAVFAVTRAHGFRFFLLFAPIAAGFILHIDPMNLRIKGKMIPIAATWGICILVSLLSIVLLR